MKDYVLEVRVSRSDIRDGVKGSCSRCPIALALWRALKSKFRRWDIHATSADCVELTGNMYRNATVKILAGRTPNSARKFMERFDKGHTVEPFNFLVTFCL